MEDSYPEEIEEKEPRGYLSVRAVVTRKDGTVEDLGIISEGWVEGWQASNGPS